VRRLVGEAADLVMVGDMISTDGRFAVALGCRFALVRTGNTAPGEHVDFLRAFDVPDLAAVAELIVTEHS
jgi:ribonucleotide monophosphatase NagD (HAD superfamily)